MLKLIQVALALFSVVLAANGQDIPAHRTVAQKLMDRINAGDYPGIEALFNAEMAKALPLAKTTSFFEGVMRQYGKLQKLDQGKRLAGTVVFPAHFERGLLDLQIALDPEGKIAGLFLKPHSGTTKSAPVKHQTELCHFTEAGSCSGATPKQLDQPCVLWPS
ncbi:MAG TPA: DUF3887 domain-containing protein [Chthoniobacterales bacterium]